MTRFLVRRALAALVLVWIVASCGFLLAAMAQGDAAELGAGFGATAGQIAAVRAEAGLHLAAGRRYGCWLSMLARGDLGTSFRYRAPVGPRWCWTRAMNTAILALTALLLALLVGLPPAIVAATRPQSMAARAVRVISLLMLSIPPFVGALVLVLIAARTGWLPAGGMTSGGDLAGLAWLADVLWHLPLPALALALPLAGDLRTPAGHRAHRSARHARRAGRTRARGVPARVRLCAKARVAAVAAARPRARRAGDGGAARRRLRRRDHCRMAGAGPAHPRRAARTRPAAGGRVRGGRLDRARDWAARVGSSDGVG